MERNLFYEELSKMTRSILMEHCIQRITLNKYAHVLPGDADKAITHLPNLR